MQIINPATEEIIDSLEMDVQESLMAKLETLKEGQRSWSNQPLAHRLKCITRFGELVQENTAELAAIMTAETGKPIQQSINEIQGAQNRIDHLNKYAEQCVADEVLSEQGPIDEKITYESLGVIVNISAWNFPYNVGYNIFLYALVAGNAVLYKPSEYASLTGKQFEKYLWLAGIPKNVFQCVFKIALKLL